MVRQTDRRWVHPLLLLIISQSLRVHVCNYIVTLIQPEQRKRQQQYYRQQKEYLRLEQSSQQWVMKFARNWIVQLGRTLILILSFSRFRLLDLRIITFLDQVILGFRYSLNFTFICFLLLFILLYIILLFLLLFYICLLACQCWPFRSSFLLSWYYFESCQTCNFHINNHVKVRILPIIEIETMIFMKMSQRVIP